MEIKGKDDIVNMILRILSHVLIGKKELHDEVHQTHRG